MARPNFIFTTGEADSKTFVDALVDGIALIAVRLMSDPLGNGVVLAELVLTTKAKQSLAESLPAGELDPEGQAEQVLDVVAPDVVEYLPLPQSLQAKDPACMHVYTQDTSCFRPAVAHMIIIYMRHREGTYNHPVLQV